jgi:threonine 3-dehydrogenase
MKAVMKTSRAAGLEMCEAPIPEIGAGEVLVRVLATSICGTDLHLYNWDAWADRSSLAPIPFVQGHELCGEIVEVGAGVTELKPGDFVSAESHIVDYEGPYYRNGQGQVAPETRIIGLHRDGSFAEFIALPWQNTRKNPPDMPLEVAVLKENFGNAVHTAHATELKGKDVLISGCGPAGMMTMLAARALEARHIVVSDIHPYRLNMARELGAELAVNPTEGNFLERVRDQLPGGEVDVVLEMSGAQPAIEDGLRLLRPGGTLVAFGIPNAPLKDFNFAELFIFPGIRMESVIGRRMWETWEQLEALLHEGLVDLRGIVTHRFSLENHRDAFETFASKESGKVMMVLDDHLLGDDS